MTMTYLNSSSAVSAITTAHDSATLTNTRRPARSESFRLMRAAGISALKRERARNASALLAFGDLWEAMKSASPFVMARSLWELGWLRNDHDVLTADDIAQRSCSADRYRPLISQWLEALVDQGIVRRMTGEARTYIGQCLDIADAQRRIDHAIAIVDVNTGYRGFIDYFLTCVRQQANLLRGDANPQKLLFPMGSWHLVDGLYRTNPASALQNAVAASLVLQAFQERTELRPLRILEVGAGTGATTKAVLNCLPSANVEYLFTDISRFFLRRATRNFGDDPRLNFRLLDIDGPVVDQGFQPGTFDIVVAANVLHTAKRIDVALEHLSELLVDSGVLVAIETTSNTALQMITFGHFDGVCHFQDRRRHSNLPFLSCAEWLAAMSEAGFAEVTSVPSAEHALNGWAQHVVMGLKGEV